MSSDTELPSVSKETLLDAPDEYLPHNLRKNTGLTALVRTSGANDSTLVKKSEERSKRKV